MQKEAPTRGTSKGKGGLYTADCHIQPQRALYTTDINLCFDNIKFVFLTVYCNTVACGNFSFEYFVGKKVFDL